MNFAKGAMLGMIAGTIVGVMNSDSMINFFNKGKREVKKLRKRYGA